MSESDCIFCKIIQGKIPAQKLFENDHVLAFLDINPLSEGHFLVVPKTHAERFHQANLEELEEVMTVLHKIAIALEVEDYNILQNNGRVAHQAVPHVHFHLIPKTTKTGLRFTWSPNEVSDARMSAVEEKIRENLQST